MFLWMIDGEKINYLNTKVIVGITRNYRTGTEYRTGTIPKNLGRFLVPCFPYFRFSVLSGRFRFRGLGRFQYHGHP